MKIGVYEIINDPKPKLYKIKSINADLEEFKSENGIVDVLNRELKVNKLNAEHLYVIAQARNLFPLGILLCAIGHHCGVEYNNRTLGIGLLLLGAERFTLIHNHPFNNNDISYNDVNVTNKVEELSELLGIRFDNHIMITYDDAKYCIEENVVGQKERSAAALKKLKEMVKNNKEAVI